MKYIYTYMHISQYYRITNIHKQLLLNLPSVKQALFQTKSSLKLVFPMNLQLQVYLTFGFTLPFIMSPSFITSSLPGYKGIYEHILSRIPTHRNCYQTNYKQQYAHCNPTSRVWISIVIHRPYSYPYHGR